MKWPWSKRREEYDTGLLEFVETQADRIEARSEEILKVVKLIEAEIKTMQRTE